LTGGTINHRSADRKAGASGLESQAKIFPRPLRANLKDSISWQRLPAPVKRIFKACLLSKTYTPKITLP
jgi:hypothetical protein